MNTESVALVVSKVEELIRAAGGKVEAFYPYLVRQALIAGYFSLFGMCLAMICILSIFAVLLSGKSTYDERYSAFTGWGFTAIGFGVIAFISLLCATGGSVTFLAVFNPNFYAVKLLMGLAK